MAQASEALRLAVGEACGEVRRVASGRSSTAWAASSPSGDWIVRVPVPDSGRRLSYRSEALIGELLHALGPPVPTWRLVERDGTMYSVAPRLHGRPVNYGETFPPRFAAELGRLLGDLHRLDASGFGPLEDDTRILHGRSSSALAGVVDRWFHASIWPFDGSDLSSHAVTQVAPQLVGAIEALRPEIVEAIEGPLGVVHSDLHRQHLLVDGGDQLGAVLDFGDAFRGAVAWDFALLHWYYGEENAARIAAAHPDADTDGIRASAALLAVAVGLYKLAKSPGDPDVPKRLRRVVDPVANDLT